MDKELKGGLFFPEWVHHSGFTISSVHIHPHSPLFATGGLDDCVKIWNIEPILNHGSNGTKLIAIITDHKGGVNMVRFSPDGMMLASCSVDSTVIISRKTDYKLVDSETPKNKAKDLFIPNKPIEKWESTHLSVHTSDVTTISWSCDSSVLASGSLDGEIILWDIVSKAPSWRYMSKSGVNSLSYDPFGHNLIAQLQDSSLLVIDTKGKQILESITNKRYPNNILHMRNDWTIEGSYYSSCTGKDVTFNRRSTNSPSFVVTGHQSPISVVSSGPKAIILKQNLENLVAIGDTSGLITIWLLGNEVPEPFLIISEAAASDIHDISWFPDSTQFAFVAEKGARKKIPCLCIFQIRTDISDIFASEVLLAKARQQVFGSFTERPRLPISTLISKYLPEEPYKQIDILDLTTEQVLEQQEETILNGVRTIKPVLISIKNIKTSYFKVVHNGKPVSNSGYKLEIPELNWKCPIMICEEPSFCIIVDEIAFVTAGNMLYFFSVLTGVMKYPSICVGRCHHLSGTNHKVLVVTDKCRLISTENCQIIDTFPKCDRFVEYEILDTGVIIARTTTEQWCWSKILKSWIGGITLNINNKATFDDIEELVYATDMKTKAYYYHDLSVNAVWEHYIG